MNEFNQLEIKQKLPNDPMFLIFGIVSLFFVLIGCCCGFFSIIPGLVFGIIAWYLSSSGIKAYNISPDLYTITSYNNAKTAKTISIIATILALFGLLMTVFYFVGLFAQPEFFDVFQDMINELK